MVSEPALILMAPVSPFDAVVDAIAPVVRIVSVSAYFDSETGFHYNWLRYYDPDTGRFRQYDPKGLGASIDGYSYASTATPTPGGDPLNAIDPLGDRILDLARRNPWGRAAEEELVGRVIGPGFGELRQLRGRLRGDADGIRSGGRMRQSRGHQGLRGTNVPIPGRSLSCRQKRGACRPQDAALLPAQDNRDWRRLRDHWDDLGYGDILSPANRKRIADRQTPIVHDNWIRAFPGDAPLKG